MSGMIFAAFLFASALFADFSTLYVMPHTERQGRSDTVWEVKAEEPFNELILSWNAPREADAQYTFFVSLRQNGDWSPWLYYGDWGKTGQMLPVESPEDSFAETNRGTTRPKTGFCDGFRVHLLANGKEGLSPIRMFSASLSNLSRFSPSSNDCKLPSVLLENVPAQSLNMLRLDRHYDMCLGAAMISAVKYLSKRDLDTSDYIAHTMDNDFESHDFYPLHAAESYHRLGGAYQVRIVRLNGFEEIHSRLVQSVPIVVSVQGTPSGGFPWPFYRPHMLTVIGYNAESDKVACLDPIFPTNKSSYQSYLLEDFLRIWGKKQNIACVFEKIE